MINTLDVVEITTKTLMDDGLYEGDRVVVAGVKAIPVTKEDPYTQRIKLFVQKLNENEDGVDGNVFVIDPASVKETGLRAVDDSTD